MALALAAAAAGCGGSEDAPEESSELTTVEGEQPREAHRDAVAAEPQDEGAEQQAPEVRDGAQLAPAPQGRERREALREADALREQALEALRDGGDVAAIRERFDRLRERFGQSPDERPSRRQIREFRERFGIDAEEAREFREAARERHADDDADEDPDEDEREPE